MITFLKEALLKEHFKKLILLYGESSIKRSGLYDEITSLLKELDLNYAELGGIPANPTLSKVIEARSLIIDEGCDFILAVGGGSVMDAAKAIAVAAYVPEEEIWDIFERKRWFEKAMPLGG